MTLNDKIGQVIGVLAEAVRDYAPVSFASSLGAEDMVLTDLIAKHQPGIEIFTLDTNLLPGETYRLMQEVRRHYGIPLQAYCPDTHQVAEYVAHYGKDGFYGSVEARKRCCYIRKVEPLRRALSGKGAWITGMRQDQAVTRGSLELSSFDDGNGLHKFNPLLDWSNDDVWAYIRQFGVPYNELHDRFYPSIGCAPCTRAVTPGEDIRAGRWWWENPESKECGLHVQSATGRSADALRVSAQGNVGGEAADVSRSQNPENKECGLHVVTLHREERRTAQHPGGR